ncbi:MAG: response regulator transcription factor [Solirubrobacterales bacterium]
MRTLVVEDEPKMARLIARALQEGGAVSDTAATGSDALWMATSTRYDAIVLDVMLPDLDGFEVCRRLRADGVWAPVLMLTARDAVADRVAGLDAGADDYLAKPFAIDELLARLRALARRGAVPRPAVLEVGALRLDPASGRAWFRDAELELSSKEFAMLEAFIRRPGQVLSRAELLDLVWDHAYDNRSNVVDVYVRYLREKIDRRFGVTALHTVRGRGYRLDAVS